MTELLVITLLVLGGAFAAIAGIGLVRLPDVLIRMHASTKAGTLGVGLIVLSVAVHYGDLFVTTKAVLIIFFLLLTAPVAAHLIGRAAYRTGTPLWKRTALDELHGQSRRDIAPRADVDRSNEKGERHAPL
ncbi:MAG: monovalent cation/H(+) antiporter subunit G [Geminicoccaceae bacterium]